MQCHSSSTVRVIFFLRLFLYEKVALEEGELEDGEIRIDVLAAEQNENEIPESQHNSRKSDDYHLSRNTSKRNLEKTASKPSENGARLVCATHPMSCIIIQPYTHIHITYTYTHTCTHTDVHTHMHTRTHTHTHTPLALTH